MVKLNDIPLIEAHPRNYNPINRAHSSIKYVVIHYTSNTNDTARNNVTYFHDAITQTSAHYFVSDNSIYQSVPLNHAAYAVGIGSMKNPYFKWPTMWKKITNSNSVSIEICGGKTGPEPADNVKKLAAELTSELLKKLGLSPSCVYRHYDVTGKPCPKWAVDDNLKWLEFMLWVSNYFYGKDVDNLTDSPENYNMFKTWFERYLKERSAMIATWEVAAMNYCDEKGIIKDGRPKSILTRGELAEVMMRVDKKYSEAITELNKRMDNGNG